MFSFNLIEEKWLPCILVDNTVEELSLKDVLTKAFDIKELIGDSPPITIALHRLLLAVLHRALNAPNSYEDWESFWRAKNWNADGKLENYLNHWKHRFDLFDVERPFYQVSSVKDKIQDGAIIQLYFQGKNNATLFDHSTTSVPNAVTPSEAARLLITFQGFDFGGTKADGSAQTAPLLQSAISLVCGKNLFETLMLNWHGYDEEDGVPFEFANSEDLPPWERKSETESKERTLDGYVDLLTWQARRILLHPEQSDTGEIVVKNTVIMKGFQFPKDYERHNKETMMAFQKSKKTGFYSVGFSENKALWRNSLTLFQTVENERYKPKILDWLNQLVDEEVLENSSIFPLDFYGLAADKGKLLFWQHEKFFLPVKILDNKELLSKIELAIEFAEDISDKVLRFSLKTLADDLETNLKNFPALSVYWARLETRFKKLLVELPNQENQSLEGWFRYTDDLAKNVFKQTANSMSGSAEEQRAIVESENAFYSSRKKLLNNNSEYRELLPKHKTKGGEE
ncbi:MAG: type I-E CRISPR-associated protein Cse1/CasA [Pyrinomonadaceae bacterium]